jgi:mRNA interferase MazF
LQKTRPAVIVNDDSVGLLPLKVIVPLTAWKEHYRQAPWLVRRLGTLTASQMKSISAALSLVLSIEP